MSLFFLLNFNPPAQRVSLGGQPCRRSSSTTPKRVWVWPAACSHRPQNGRDSSNRGQLRRKRSFPGSGGCVCRWWDDSRSLLPLFPGLISHFVFVHGCLAPGWEEGFVPRLFQKGRGPGQLVSQRNCVKLRGPTVEGHGLLCPGGVQTYSKCCLYIIWAVLSCFYSFVASPVLI